MPSRLTCSQGIRPPLISSTGIVLVRLEVLFLVLIVDAVAQLQHQPGGGDVIPPEGGGAPAHPGPARRRTDCHSRAARRRKMTNSSPLGRVAGRHQSGGLVAIHNIGLRLARHRAQVSVIPHLQQLVAGGWNIGSRWAGASAPSPSHGPPARWDIVPSSYPYPPHLISGTRLQILTTISTIPSRKKITRRGARP